MTVRAVDVCVIGSGASGSVAAGEFLRAGRSVLLLEEGPGRPGRRMADVEPGWPAAYAADDGEWKPVGRPWTARGFGGGTAYYAGIAFRFRLVDFDVRAHVAADAMDPKWPIDYEDLRPYYDEIEERVGIARTDDGDPLAPPSRAAVMPPHPFSLPGTILADAARVLGMQPFPTPLAVNSVPYGGRPACTHMTPCNGYACPTRARADAPTVFLADVMGHDALWTATRSRAVHIELERPDQAGWVEWLDLPTRTRHRTRVGQVVLAANAVQSAALLLRSAQRWATTGLGNRHDMVGRGLSFKVSGSVSTTLPMPLNRGGSVNGPHSTVAFSDCYLDSRCPTGLGGQMYETTAEARAASRGRVSVTIHFVAGDQPMRRNRVMLVGDRDEFGVRRVGFDYTTHPVDVERLHYLEKQATQVLVASGAEAVVCRASGYERGSRHLHGGCRAGDDPAESVVDRMGRIHDVVNVHVADGGFFPFAGGVNPTLTIQANALRISRAVARGTGFSR